MKKLSFATFDPLIRDTPASCDICRSGSPIFSYELRTQDEHGERRNIYGFCCAACGPRLLKKLEREESREWAAEEAALEADDIDISDFHERRAAAFGIRSRN
jgi:hypothetical protein